MNGETIINKLIALRNPEKAEVLSSFFQTKKGEYAAGDVFLGVTVPQNRKVAAPYTHLPLLEVEKLLQSKYHESRFVALVILVDKFERGNKATKEAVYNFYLNHTQRINNLDLVDVSSYKIVGSWLLDKDRAILYDLAKSTWLWHQRIAIVSTMAFIRNHEFEDRLRLSEYFFTHPHHLIHKACGWMIREVGKRNKATLTQFLNNYAPQMPRMMLRYSIEKQSKEERKSYLRTLI